MKHWKILLLLVHLSTQLVLAVASDCENEWEENGGKCYFFSQDELTWVGAEEECKMRNGSHLASVTDKQTDDFIGRQIERGEAIWIGAKQAIESGKARYVAQSGAQLFGGSSQTAVGGGLVYYKAGKGTWGWADGCSPWNYTSWADQFDPHGKHGFECAFYEKSFGKVARWRAGKCDDIRQRLKYVCSKSTCQPIDTKTTMDPIIFNITVGASVGVGVLLLIAAAVFICKKMKKRQTKPEEESTDQNPLYGQYYKVDGERVDERRVYVEDSNVYYSRRIKQ